MWFTVRIPAYWSARVFRSLFRTTRIAHTHTYAMRTIPLKTKSFPMANASIVTMCSSTSCTWSNDSCLPKSSQKTVLRLREATALRRDISNFNLSVGATHSFARSANMWKMHCAFRNAQINDFVTSHAFSFPSLCQSSASYDDGVFISQSLDDIFTEWRMKCVWRKQRRSRFLIIFGKWATTAAAAAVSRRCVGIDAIGSQFQLAACIDHYRAHILCQINCISHRATTVRGKRVSRNVYCNCTTATDLPRLIQLKISTSDRYRIVFSNTTLLSSPLFASLLCSGKKKMKYPDPLLISRGRQRLAHAIVGARFCFGCVENDMYCNYDYSLCIHGTRTTRHITRVWMVCYTHAAATDLSLRTSLPLPLSVALSGSRFFRAFLFLPVISRRYLSMWLSHCLFIRQCHMRLHHTSCEWDQNWYWVVWAVSRR